ncbi:MAG: type II toxin-antitoxin system PemK/MazF family toxin [Ilumatobacter sp.]|nr:type II toxin-antitoxin system PemK/MazF family toxin [Ilumatobacter sp.]MDJ0771195.1 type II toxin-antitoxin system PemK/MazF family toxin [Ilumatobacter sp.]
MIERGEIWWADLVAPTGSGPGYRRPVVVISAGSFNQSRIATVIVAMISSNTALAAAPGNVALAAGTVGLTKDSVVNVSQLATLDRRHLTERVGRLDLTAQGRVDHGLRLALDLAG